MRVSVVGLGPGPAEWVTPAALARLRLPRARVFLRTRHLPDLEILLEGLTWESFDALYETATTLDEVHATMASRLLRAGDEVVLAVPGDGVLGEAVVLRLLEANATIEVIPGVPLAAGALSAAGIAAPDGAQVVEGTSLGGSGIDLLIELNPRWPAVITGVYNPRVGADVKLALQRVYPSEHGVMLVRHPGLPDGRVVLVSLAELDRTDLE